MIFWLLSHNYSEIYNKQIEIKPKLNWFQKVLKPQHIYLYISQFLLLFIVLLQQWVIGAISHFSHELGYTWVALPRTRIMKELLPVLDPLSCMHNVNPWIITSPWIYTPPKSLLRWRQDKTKIYILYVITFTKLVKRAVLQETVCKKEGRTGLLIAWCVHSLTLIFKK